MSYISSAGFPPELTIVKVHIRHTNLVPEIEVKVLPPTLSIWLNRRDPRAVLDGEVHDTMGKLPL